LEYFTLHFWSISLYIFIANHFTISGLKVSFKVFSLMGLMEKSLFSQMASENSPTFHFGISGHSNAS